MVCHMSPVSSAGMHAELTASDLAELRARLGQARVRLMAANVAEYRAEGADDTAASDASTDVDGDLGDRSTDQQAWDDGHQELLDRETQLAEVEHALGKLALGTYGVCETCRRPVPVARLRFVPEARYDRATI